MDGAFPLTPLITFALLAAKLPELLTVFPAILPTEKPELDELTLERVLEELETLCHQNMAQATRTLSATCAVPLKARMATRWSSVTNAMSVCTRWVNSVTLSHTEPC